jgi:hypothetical protein
MLRAFSKKIDVFRLAFGAKFRNGLDRATIVAFEAVAVLVMRHGDAAVHALHGGAAASAKHRPGIAPAVDEHEGLRLVDEAFLNPDMQLRGNGAGLVRLLKFFAEIDNFHLGESAVGDA